MNPIAVYSGSTVLYWSAIIITAGLLAALFMSLSVQISHRGRIVSMMLFFPLAVLFSVPLCRVLHWYCHQEQYGGFLKAVTDYTAGSYVLPAAIPGIWLAAALASRLDDRDSMKLLDAAAPGIALAVAFVKLSALFKEAGTPRAARDACPVLRDGNGPLLVRGLALDERALPRIGERALKVSFFAYK